MELTSAVVVVRPAGFLGCRGERRDHRRRTVGPLPRAREEQVWVRSGRWRTALAVGQVDEDSAATQVRVCGVGPRGACGAEPVVRLLGGDGEGRPQVWGVGSLGGGLRQGVEEPVCSRDGGPC